jgi:hypothetical protein
MVTANGGAAVAVEAHHLQPRPWARQLECRVGGAQLRAPARSRNHLRMAMPYALATTRLPEWWTAWATDGRLRAVSMMRRCRWMADIGRMPGPYSGDCLTINLTKFRNAAELSALGN